MSSSSIEPHIESLLKLIGEDPQREGLLKTPRRYARAFQFLTSGYKQNLKEVVGGAIFKENTRTPVIVTGISMHSLCEHHLLPFYGVVHAAYMPQGQVIGLSKIPRLVDMFARRLQLQERLCDQIADAITEAIQPAGVLVICEAAHMCMAMRGVEKQNTVTTTISGRGCYAEPGAARAEILELIKNKNASP